MAEIDQYNPNDAEFLVCQYLDGQLEGQAKADFEHRLAAEPALAELLREYRALDAQVSAAAAAKVEKVDFASQRASIMASLEREHLLSAKPRRLLVFRPVFIGTMAAAAAVLLVASVSLKMLNIGGGGAEVATPPVVHVIQPPDATDQEPVIVSVISEQSPADVPQADEAPSGTVAASVTPMQGPRDDRGAGLLSF